ncbi:cytochrome c oxidase subunit II [Aquisalinus luteolus]|uniref:Cytochrome aa3 subunit 2 n=1 Tax=Aquisalinus luteolus TaxID=1566827 RepID=A0A8J3A145_9PROT|nr:cytochrome c oxidase subunit II [Aquisalinus luteolus]GGH92229.1 QoxB, Quinol oxidase subunit II [Aquisalinus luteolus]
MLVGCDGALSIVDPAGPAARSIALLWWVMLVGGVLIFGLVMVLIALSFRKRAACEDDAGSARLWIVKLGIAFPVTVLLALLAYGLVIGEQLLPRESGETVIVRAEARQWAWNFSYDDLPGRTTQDVLHIPAGRPVDISITSTDVIHSFWVPRLAGKLDAIPGHVNTLRIEADRPGTYQGLSAEFSGSGYDRFTFQVIAHDETGWQAFLTGETE